MRDKVKRFLSILMTALMLVNLLPVGALAEGVMISNSVQSRAQKPDGYPVFVFVEVQGNTDGLTMNSDKWFTLGMVKSMNDVTKPPKPVTGYQNNINGVTADDVTAAMTRYKPNESINLGGIRWKGFKSENGASNTYPAYTNQACWHLDGSIRIEDLQVDYTIRYVDENNKEIASSKKKTDKAGSWTKLEKEDIKDITGYTYTDRHDPMQKLVGGKDTVINVYYTTNSYKYKVEHYYDGEIDPSRTDTSSALYGSEVDKNTLTLKPKDGYEFEKTENCPLTIGTDESKNVIKVYYKKKTNLSYKVNYLEQGTTNVLHEQKVQGEMTFDDVVKSEDEVIEINGYNYASADKEELTIGTGENVINIYYTKRTDLSYTVKYLEEVTGHTLLPEKTEGNQTFGESVTEKAVAIDGYTPTKTEETIQIGTGTNEIIFYYTKRTDLSYTVNYYWNGTTEKVAESKTVNDQTFEAVIKEAPILIDGYTPISLDRQELTITTGDNTITFYYYKNVKLTANSDTLPYNGEDQSVSGYTCAVEEKQQDGSVEYVPWTGEKPLTFEGVSASGSGKDVNKNGYPVTFNDTPIGETDGLYYVNESQTGTLTITPAPVTLQAPIASKSYDGTPLEATQFGHSYLEGLDFADDFESIILTGSQTLVGSSASLITGVIPKEGKQLKNYNFTFVPGTLTVTDGTGEEEKPVDPAKVITKTHIPKDMGYNLGEPVTFTISVKNIYNTPKTITLTEKENVKFSNGENAIEFKDVPAGETVTAEATYTITSEDILEGVFHNTVTADFTGGGSWTAEDTVTTAELDTTLNVTKTSDVPDGQKAALGQKITYTIKVQNAGNVPYTNVKVEDPLTKLTATIETLAVGETKTFTTEYVVTEADVLEGHVLNTATAKGDEIKDPKSDEPKEPNGGDEVETPTFAPITLKPKDVTATYNGAAITGKDVEITSGKLLEGHKLSAAVIGSGVNAGSYELTLDPEKITIVDANNKDVSEMYARTILPGKLIINKRSVLITSPSATKTYDGSALTRPAVTITGDGFVPGELAKAEATGSITKVGSTPNAIQYTTTGAFNAANYSIALSVGTLTVTEKPKPEPRRTFNLTINYVYQNGKRAAASYNRGGLKNGETFDITSPVIAGYTASETVVSGTIYNRDIKVTVIYTADGVNLDDYGVPLGLGNITMNVGDCFE